MIKFKSLSVQNFLSYGAVPTIFNLDPGGTTLIVGEDLDNTASGTGANGVGKTVWLNALIFGLYGKPISNISLDNLVNNINNTHMEVVVEFEKDNRIYTIKRVRKEKGKTPYAKVHSRAMDEKLDWNSKSQDVTPDSIKNITEFITNILGIPYELFVRIVAFSATHTPFLDLPVRHASQANQSDIMEELFRLNRLSENAATLKEEIKHTKQSLDIKQKHNEQLVKEHERHNSQLESAKERVDNWIEDNKLDISDETKVLSELEKYDIPKQEKLFDSLVTQNDKLKELESTIKDLNIKIKEFDSEYNSAQKEFELLDYNSSNAATKQETWEIDHKNKLEEFEAAKSGLISEDILREQEFLNNTHTEFLEELDTTETEISTSTNSISALDVKIKDLTEELSHLEEAKCPYCLQKYENAEEKIISCKSNLDDLNDELKEHTSILKLTNKLHEKITNQISEIKNELQYNVNQIASERQLSLDLFKEINKLQEEKNPYEFDFDAEEKRMAALDDDMEAIDLARKDLKEDRDGIIIECDSFDARIETTLSKIEFKSIEDLYEVKNNIKHSKSKLKDLKGAKNPHLDSYKELKDSKLEPVDMDTVNELDKLLTHQNYLLKLLTKKDSFIRKNLLNKNLVFLNQQLRGYLQDLGLPHRVEFTQEMTAHISQFGRQLDFGNLSSGQKARVNLALSFSFRDVLQRSLDSVNVCILDEVLDVGLDGVGVQNAARMLKHKAREDNMSLYIISHRDEVSGIFDKKLVVQMHKGFSSIKEEE